MPLLQAHSFCVAAFVFINLEGGCHLLEVCKIYHRKTLKAFFSVVGGGGMICLQQSQKGSQFVGAAQVNYHSLVRGNIGNLCTLIFKSKRCLYFRAERYMIVQGSAADGTRSRKAHFSRPWQRDSGR